MTTDPRVSPGVTGFSGRDQPSPSIYDRCIRCGLCLTSCPTYLETMTETSGPRGRISLIKAVGEGHLDLLSTGFVEQMSECLDCRACEAVCPSGVRYGQLVETARTQISRELRPKRGSVARALRQLLLRTLFVHHHVMRAAAALLRFAQGTRLTSLAGLVGLSYAADLAPRVPNRFFLARGQSFNAASPAGLAFLHTGCVMQVFFPAVHEATVRMLVRARLSVTIPGEQGCCGALALHAGDLDLAREFGRRNIAAFERSGADVYVVNAAGCGSVLKEYGDLFATDTQWQGRAQRFSQRVRDVTEVLDAMPLPEPEPSGAAATTVTYQEPCHLVHAQRISIAPRRLLRTIPGLQLIEMDESSVCCGSAGVYNLTQPVMASRLRQRKVSNIVRTGARVVATANPGCAIQVAAGLRAAGYAADVRHVVELLDAAYSQP
jgi:glycolate oxidase iron-sulfur subunit